MSDISDWYNRVPIFTKWWLTLTLVFSLAGRIGLVKPYQMILLQAPFFSHFEVSTVYRLFRLPSRIKAIREK